MTRRINLTAVLLLFCSLPLSAWGQQYYLYEPRPLAAEEKGGGKNGILTTELSIQKGDTLYDISRKFSGRGMYYPQILLFNKIKNPNMIYSGSTLRIPITRDQMVEKSASAKKRAAKLEKIEKAAEPVAAEPASSNPRVAGKRGAAPVSELSPHDLKALDELQQNRRVSIKKSAKRTHAIDSSKKLPVAGSTVTEAKSSGQDATATARKQFESAIKAYKQNDFKGAIDMFDRYLANNSNSPLAADASLYKAECYLKLSTQ